MDDRAWVGPATHCPAGWLEYQSVEALLAAPCSPNWIVLDDRAGVLRESDFGRLYGYAPLAKIERIVGPWRAGVGRTDPQWPLATTRRDDSLSTGVSSTDEATWHPLTSGYDDLATEATLPDLAGLIFDVQITDTELRKMWIDWLAHSGGELSCAGQVDVLICDNFHTSHEDALSVVRCVVMLAPDPWNADSPLNSDGTQSKQPQKLVVSVLDSPARVMQRVMAILPRVTL